MTLHLTAGQRAWLKTELEVRQQRLDGLLSRHHEGASRVEHAHGVLADDDEASRQHAMDREVDLELSDLDTAELGAVSRALLRFQEGSYGVCTACGTEIPFDRLKVEPQAMRCVACESAAEAHARRPA
ncbi:MAG: TraR/DksA C4-type zinc finger protein [Betaproteobacteria bacterium]